MDSICWRIKVQINLCNIFTHSWRSSWLWGCVCCHFQAEWLSAAKCTLSTPSLSPGSRKKNNPNWLSVFPSLLLFRRSWTSATSWWSCLAGTAGFCWAPIASSTSTTAPETSWWRRATLPPRWDSRQASYESLWLTHHQSNLAELSVVQWRANTCCIVSFVISWEPNWDFLFSKNAFWQPGPDGELCVLSVAPQRLLHVRDIASFEVSQPAHFAGIKRSATAHACQKLGPVHFEVVRVFL